MRNTETIEFSLDKKTLAEMDALIPGVYLNREELIRSAVKEYIRDEKILSQAERYVPVIIDTETATRLDELCNRTGKDYMTVLTEALDNYLKAPDIDKLLIKDEEDIDEGETDE